MMTRWSGSAHGAALKTSSPPPSASTLMTPMLWLLLKQPPPIFLTNSILLELADSASGLGLKNGNPKLKTKANSRRIGLQNAEPGDDDGNEDDDDDDDDAVRSGGVAAIMEQRMNDKDKKINRKAKKRCTAIAERSTVRRNEGSFGEFQKPQTRKRGHWRTTIIQLKQLNIEREREYTHVSLIIIF